MRKEYTVKELINNESFQRFIKGTASSREISRWDSWMEESEQNREKAKKAISEIAGFEFKDPKQPDIEEEWKRLFDTTLGKKQADVQHIQNRRSSTQWIQKIAAVFLFGAMISMGIYLKSETDQISTQLEQITEERTIKTGMDEHKTVKLSNGSRIILNSNSKMTYHIGLLHGQIIEVVLEGEAYFEAESNPEQKDPVFAVQTPDGTIRDIGTEFLVTVQEDRSRVVLQEGEVEIHTKEQNDKSLEINVQKGEMVEFDKSSLLSKKTVNSTFYTSWATGLMKFDQTTIREFARVIEEEFNVKVLITESDLADVTIDGGIYFKSLEELVRSVTKVAKMPVRQSEDRDTVYIGGS